MSTPYEVLGIQPGATKDEIRAAYKRAAMKHHPDRGGSPKAFQDVQEAYTALQDRICPDCGNKGSVTTRRGVFVSKEPCPRCWSIR